MTLWVTSECIREESTNFALLLVHVVVDDFGDFGDPTEVGDLSNLFGYRSIKPAANYRFLAICSSSFDAYTTDSSS